MTNIVNQKPKKFNLMFSVILIDGFVDSDAVFSLMAN